MKETNETKIPKVIHYVWFSGDEKPELMKKCIASWHKVVPDYEFKEWGMKEVEEIRKDPKNRYLDQALKMKKWSYATDFLRLWILYHEGGIYLDTDVEIIKPFSDDILNNGFFTCYEWLRYIEAAVMGCVKGHHLAKEFLELYQDKDFVKDCEEGYDVTIIPVNLVNHYLKKYKKYHDRLRHTINGDIHIYPYTYFSPKKTINYKIHKNTYTVHHFTNSYSKNPNKKLSFKRIVVNCMLAVMNYRTFRWFVRVFMKNKGNL